MKRIIYKQNQRTISEVMEEISDTLSFYKVNRKQVLSSGLLIEEVLVKLLEVAKEDSEIHILIKSFAGKVTISLSLKADKADIGTVLAGNTTGEFEPETEEAIRNMIIKAYGDKLTYTYSKGTNKVKVNVLKSDKSSVYSTLISMFSAVFVGLAIRLLFSQEIVNFITNNIFSPIWTIFLNAIKMVMAPLVFFSLAACIADFTDLKTLGRMGIKILLMYCFTTIVAISTGFGLDQLFKPGLNAGGNVLEGLGLLSGISNIDGITLKDTIINIVPANFLGAFVNSDMIQIIFIAILVGIASEKVQNYNEAIKGFLFAGETLFSNIVKRIIVLMPIAVFASMAKMVITIDLSTIKSLLLWTAVETIALIIMLLVYGTLLAVLTRLNPFKLFRKAIFVLLTAFCTSSSSATIPTSMDFCDKQLGISPKLYSFSIPFGATINMDGSSICYVTMALFLARITGVEISGNLLFTLFVSVFLLSIATPGVPGATVACSSLLLAQMNIPVNALSIVVGFMPLLTMFQTAVNVMGDCVATTVVAKSENMIDLNKYNS